MRKPEEIPQVQFLVEVVDMFLCCATTGAWKPVEIHQVQFLANVAVTPVVMQ